MPLYCQCRCCSSGPILVAPEKRIPCIWWRRRGGVQLWAKWDVEREAALLGLSSPSAQVWNTCSTLPAQPDQRGKLPSDIAWHYRESWGANSPWQQHIWRGMGEEAVNPFPWWSNPCSTSTRELLQHCSGVQNSASASRGCCCQPSVQVYFSFRCEEGDKAGIYWIWGTSCQHSCSAKWLHVQGNPSASGWDLQPFVPFSLGPNCFLQWSEAGGSGWTNAFLFWLPPNPVTSISFSFCTLHLLMSCSHLWLS